MCAIPHFSSTFLASDSTSDEASAATDEASDSTSDGASAATSDEVSVTKFLASSVFSVTDSVSDNAYTHLEGFKKHIHKMIFHITIFLCRLRFLKMLPSAILNSD